LDEALTRAENEAGAVVIKGREGLFSAGLDLKEVRKGNDAGMALLDHSAVMFLRLYGLPQPLLATCTGHGVAAGALMLLSADTRIGTLGAFQIGLNETAINSPFPVFAYELAHGRLSKRHLTSALVQATTYSPEGAVDAGFLDEVVDADALMDTVLAEAERLAALPVETYATNKQHIRAGSLAAMRTAIHAETFA
jgi:enoyl-CoA hydratase